MAEDNEDRLLSMLEGGWRVVGFSTTIMAAGAMTHSTLLQNGSNLVSSTVIANGEREIGRTFLQISPAPAPKKGWF